MMGNFAPVRSSSHKLVVSKHVWLSGRDGHAERLKRCRFNPGLGKMP